jgi:hypothetical protein
VFEAYGKVNFIDFERGQSEGQLRLETPEEATKAVAALTEAKKEFGGKVGCSPAAPLLLLAGC